MIFTDVDYGSSQLIEASNFLNRHYAGLTMEEVRVRLKTEVEQLRDEREAAGIPQVARWPLRS